MKRVFVLVIALVVCKEILRFVQNDRGDCFAQIWVARYDGPAHYTDDALAIAVDGSHYVYVTGTSYGLGTGLDYATIKYNSFDDTVRGAGDTLWVRRYNGPGNGHDRASEIAVDNNGNVYVTGNSRGESGTGGDYATIKYNSAGDTLWVRRYNGPGNGSDGVSAIAVDSTGNVYVTGTSLASDFWNDCATIKYNSAGDTVWVRRYNGPGNGANMASSIAVDGTGNVYVAGASDESGNADFLTIKYNSAGDTLWVRRYNGPGNGPDGASAIAVDGTGNVYLTGGSGWSNNYHDCDYATVKYNSAGVEQWVRRYNGPGNFHDEPMAMAVDGAGNVYVTGWSYNPDTSNDYATIKYNSAGVKQWVRIYNGPANSGDEVSAIAVDGTGNVYVTGGSVAFNFMDYATIKYTSSGNIGWVERYNGPGGGGDDAWAIAVDGAGNVYVTGGSIGIWCDYATIKYSGAGIEENYRLQIADYRLEIWPNPFTWLTVISYQVLAKSKVCLEVYDVAGRLMKTLVDKEIEPGYYRVELGPGDELLSGIYFVKFKTGNHTLTKKLILVK